MAPTQRFLSREQLAKKPSVSLSLFLEMNNLEVDHEVACAATCFWAKAVWKGKWVDERSVETAGAKQLHGRKSEDQKEQFSVR